MWILHSAVMSTTIQLCGLLLYAVISIVSSQERVWHSSTPTPVFTSSTTSVSPTTTITTPSSTTTTKTVAPTTTEHHTPAPASTPDAVLPAREETKPVVLAEGVVPAEVQRDSAQHDPREDKQPEQDVLNQETAPEEGKKDKKERKWMSIAKAEKSSAEETKEQKVEEIIEAAQAEETKKDFEAIEEISPETNLEEHVEEQVKTDGGKKKKKPRKWMSVPTEVAVPTPEPETFETLPEEIDKSSNVSTESAPKEDVDTYSLNGKDLELPKNISELLMAAEEGIPMVQETIISKKTTIYVTISDAMGDEEPLYVNLTGIRSFTGQERRMVGGCLDLSDLLITGEEAKEIIQRMSKYKFHKINLSNNNITEFPSNTFSPVAFSVRELRLDGNPLASNHQGEGSVLHRGGLFHLTELRELNLSSCGLQDMDLFTPWNSNHLEVVDLSCNRLRTVPSNLQFFHKLKKLYLDANPITRVTELPFALLWNLHVLSMSGCNVASITSDPFRNMEKLKEISLEGNNLTRIGDVRLPRSNSAVKMFLSGNPWHCSCDVLQFIEHYHYSIRDLEFIRCASPRWLEGLRTAYLTKEILSLDSIDGNCSPARLEMVTEPIPQYSTVVRADHLEVLALAVFVLAAVFMLVHVIWSRKKEKLTFEEERDDIHYIRIDKKHNFR